jgi:CheY-like chemotaxis protein
VPKVLLVEDNKLTRMICERILAKAGFDVATARDGEEALKAAGDEKPDLILLDMMLPKMSGNQVLRHLKSNSRTAPIPVIVLTALSEKNAAKLGQDGAAGFVTKNAALDLPEVLPAAICRVLQIQPPAGMRSVAMAN